MAASLQDTNTTHATHLTTVPVLQINKCAAAVTDTMLVKLGVISEAQTREGKDEGGHARWNALRPTDIQTHD